MAQVHHVARATQRYEMVPLLDRAGHQMIAETARKTKNGRTVTRHLTVADKTKPLPNRECDRCHGEIKIGDPYKWIAPKSGPYGGRRRIRCGKCPAWQIWEYSDSLSARLARIAHDFWDAIGEIRELAEEKRESAGNIEEGFGHATSQSEELAQIADDLESWADEVRDHIVSLERHNRYLEERCKEVEAQLALASGTHSEIKTNVRLQDNDIEIALPPDSAVTFQGKFEVTPSDNDPDGITIELSASGSLCVIPDMCDRIRVRLME